MKYFILPFCILIHLTVYGQFKIGAVAGIHQGYIYAAENSVYFQVEDSFKLDPLFGLRLEKSIQKVGIDLVLQTTFHRKNLAAGDIGLMPLVGIKFSTINSSLLIDKKIYRGLSLGGGLNYLYIPKIVSVYDSGYGRFRTEKEYNWGLIASIAYNYKEFIMGFNYCYSFAAGNIYENVFTQILEPTSFMRLQFGYMFSIDSTKSKKQ